MHWTAGFGLVVISNVAWPAASDVRCYATSPGIMVMAKYFILAALCAVLSVALSVDREQGASIGFGVSAGLCVVAAAIAEARKPPT
jgi:uncharacterized membrane protein